ncbi:L,D-transpeptidase family protein [Niallia taxi]|uniref:LysM peptidoglycan-binding domain-containing protein n=1 Tax=Niallia taxi TaxID=2499688 RepID=A0A3S2TRQ4_9BACI|nr:L,D-transpeptidase family protein [Niallia taxi]MED4040820.1 L,D-transpeptidase family protein [Niallia taxi]MED4052746.1 L,D-transpeptidase family protein [Niallia taxi]MED4120101.1 L,D-transpeptidase family protein [Niallia taxi]RVT58273.1 LysM peptidoglycan-binding domain-containing protein [Niallia taxi]
MNHIVKSGETLTQIARDYRLSLSALLQANSGINPNIINPGQIILIPGLPSPQSIPYQLDVSVGARTLRLLRNGVLQKQYPIAVGRMLTSTPVGNYVIINKAPNPGGPFGTLWMSLSKEHYGIHGTNNPSSIGKAVSKGCIRMYNKDVEELASIVPIGTAVFIHP